MEYKKALKIANKYLEKLAPHCERIEIAGSLRRKNSNVHDIELVCIPKTVFIRDGLFEGRYVPAIEFTNEVNKLEHIKGQPEGKYCQRKLKEGINLDLFICSAENWGYIFAIRTGPWQFSKDILVKYAKKAGFNLNNGYIYNRTGQLVPVTEEKYFFKLIKLDWIDPEYRIA